jgi:hypothetical protein
VSLSKSGDETSGWVRAVPGLAPGKLNVECVAMDGTLHAVPLADAARVQLTDMQPSRRFEARKGQRNLPGRWWSATDARHVGYESWLARDQVMWLDWDQAVTGIALSRSTSTEIGGRDRVTAVLALLDRPEGSVLRTRPTTSPAGLGLLEFSGIQGDRSAAAMLGGSAYVSGHSS